MLLKSTLVKRASYLWNNNIGSGFFWNKATKRSWSDGWPFEVLKAEAAVSEGKGHQSPVKNTLLCVCNDAIYFLCFHERGKSHNGM